MWAFPATPTKLIYHRLDIIMSAFQTKLQRILYVVHPGFEQDTRTSRYIT